MDGTLGGISIKLSSNQSITNEINESDAFDASTVTQFEYTYNPNLVPGLWYDISNVNGYLQDESCGSWPFELYGGLTLEGTSTQCPSVTCPPNNCTCSAAYTHWDDNWATKSCRNNNSLILTLCSTVSDQSVLQEALVDNDSVQAQDIIVTSMSTSIALSCSSR